MAFHLISSEFKDGSDIPLKYTRLGNDLSPPLQWGDPPEGTRSFALIVDDPDAPEEGTFKHWAIYDIPAERRELRQGESAETDLPQAMNHFGETRYDGPEPIAGHGPHHYRFILSALDVPNLEVPPNPSVQDVRESVTQHSIEDTQLVGRFERASKQM